MSASRTSSWRYLKHINSTSLRRAAAAVKGKGAKSPKNGRDRRCYDLIVHLLCEAKHADDMFG